MRSKSLESAIGCQRTCDSLLSAKLCGKMHILHILAITRAPLKLKDGISGESCETRGSRDRAHKNKRPGTRQRPAVQLQVVFLFFAQFGRVGQTTRFSEERCAPSRCPALILTNAPSTSYERKRRVSGSAPSMSSSPATWPSSSRFSGGGGACDGLRNRCSKTRDVDVHGFVPYIVRVLQGQQLRPRLGWPTSCVLCPSGGATPKRQRWHLSPSTASRQRQVKPGWMMVSPSHRKSDSAWHCLHSWIEQALRDEQTHGRKVGRPLSREATRSGDLGIIQFPTVGPHNCARTEATPTKVHSLPCPRPTAHPLDRPQPRCQLHVLAKLKNVSALHQPYAFVCPGLQATSAVSGLGPQWRRTSGQDPHAQAPQSYLQTPGGPACEVRAWPLGQPKEYTCPCWTGIWMCHERKASWSLLAESDWAVRRKSASMATNPRTQTGQNVVGGPMRPEALLLTAKQRGK